MLFYTFLRFFVLCDRVVESCKGYITFRRCSKCPLFKCKSRGGVGLCMHPSWDEFVPMAGHYPYKTRFSRCDRRTLHKVVFNEDWESLKALERHKRLFGWLRAE